MEVLFGVEVIAIQTRFLRNVGSSMETLFYILFALVYELALDMFYELQTIGRNLGIFKRY